MKQTDLILKNGVIYTMAREGDVVEALAVRDGKIVYTGTTEEVLGACEAPQVVDLAGKTMLPGMGDSHLHFFAYCQTHTTVDLGGCTSKAEAIGKLAARAAETPKGQWIKGSNFDESKWDADNDHLPTKADLDLVSPDHPVMMKRVCLHTAVANTAALAAAGIGKGYEFVNQIVGGSIPKEYIPAVDAGIQGAMFSGTVAGYPVVDVKVTLYDGSYHEVDSSEMAFKIAGSMAFKEAMRKADPTLLEPIMKVSVIVPEEYMGDVIGDISARRGQIQGYEMRAGAQQIDAFVPLAEMFGYATDLRSRTQGRGQYTMEPSHYIELPKGLQEKLINKRTGRENF